MKKFSTAALILALAPVLAAPAFAAGKGTCEFRADAPDKHAVVKGDTLWGISGKFLERPWCWPQVWGMNREQIKNPHWIYPGQTVYFDRVNRRLRLGQPMPAHNGDGRLSPQIRISDIDKSGLPTISPRILEPFLSQPLIVDEDALDSMPYIVGAQEGRVKLGMGDRAYVRGNLQDGLIFNVFRPGEALRDPETKKILGYEAAHVGIVRLVRTAKTENEAHAFDVLEAKQEMGVGDRLILKPPYTLMNYVPHSPAGDVNARVVSIYGGVSYAGQYQAVTINRGKNQGIDVGTVLKIYRLGDVVSDYNGSGMMSNFNKVTGGSKVKLPDEESGTLFVFRVFNNVSYGLIMQARDTVVIGDVVRDPE